jgi:hypothetical protein
MAVPGTIEPADGTLSLFRDFADHPIDIEAAT